MIKLFKQTFKLEFNDDLQELAAIRILPGSRPFHRCEEDCLILQDRWLVQVFCRRQKEQQGLSVLEKSLVFSGRLPWNQAFPKNIRIDYLKKPCCLSYKAEKTELLLTLAVLIEIDLELLSV